MNKSNFQFLETDYPSLFSLSSLAEQSLFFDPSNTLLKLRVISEKICQYIIAYDSLEELDKMTQVERINLIKRDAEGIPVEIVNDFHSIRKSGNKASHEGVGSLPEARFMLRKMFQLVVWFYERYEEDVSVVFKMPEDGLLDEAKRSATELDEMEQKLHSIKEVLKEKEAKIKALQAQTIEEKTIRNANANKRVRKVEETEAETRERIDHQLREAGWICETDHFNFKTNKTLPVKGKAMAIAEWPCGRGWADYALFIGLELVGIIEAKKHVKNVQSDLEQARRYSKNVTVSGEITLPKHNNSFVYKVPFLFATNGKPYLEQIKVASGIWFWDARLQTNLEKPLTGWLSPKDLREKLDFDPSFGERKLKASPYDILTDEKGLNLRPYQVEAIVALEDKILNHPEDSRALIAMATGTGKTRTMIGMCYRLISSQRFRRILFLVDRRMLGDQAADSFKEVKIEGLQTFAQIYDIQDLASKASELDTKIHFASVQSMVHRIEYSDDAPSVGEYDCIVVDEAHRGYTLDREMDDEEFILRDQKEFQSTYRKVLDYFDAYRIGLTATPAVHTEEIFGTPVYLYSYRQAVVEGYLIDFEPPFVFQTKLNQDGIVWDAGDEVLTYDPEENEIVPLGITEDEIKVEIQGFNRRVITDSFNRTVLSELISNPKYSIHPDDKKKTLIFAATNDHADQVVKILYEEFAEMGEEVGVDAIKKITGRVDGREDLLARYKNEQYPSIVVTVDLLTTGIDVPSICNLVFLRRVNSRILYDQMVGRATRKCDDIDKEVFKIYDCVGVTKIMEDEDVMKPVAPLVTKTFVNLADEIKIMEDEYLQQVKLDRIIAKLQRKFRSLNEEQQWEFQHLSGEPTVNDLGQLLKSLNQEELVEQINKYEPLWDYLDRQKASYNLATLYSEHEDVLMDTQRAYHKNLKPKDYIQSFKEFVDNNRNEVLALKLVCTKPQSLSRQDLKELKLLLDKEGFSKVDLNTAFKATTNQDIVADIISMVRTASLGTELMGHDQRIAGAVDKLRKARAWNTVQLKWLDRIEKQLLHESIITLTDLEKPPFSNSGGLRQMEKVFKGDTEKVLEELNEYLYA